VLLEELLLLLLLKSLQPLLLEVLDEPFLLVNGAVDVQ